jgi:probable HAF family extracellular repeat protein
MRAGIAVATILVFSAHFSPARAQETAGLYFNGKYTYFSFPGASGTEASGVNDLGEIIGSYSGDGPSGSYSYHLGLGAPVALSPPVPPGAYQPQGLPTAYAINNLGDITVSNYSTKSGPLSSYVFNGDDILTTISGPPGTDYIAAYGINDLGQVVGQYRTNQTYYSGFIYTGHSYTTLSISGFATEANGINDFGEVVGFYQDSSVGKSFGFLYDNGKYTTLAFPGATNTEANDINNLGEVIGYYDNNSGEHGFSYFNGVYTNLPGIIPYGINDFGLIVGVSPGLVGTPEPSTWAMMLFGFAGLIYAGRNRSKKT